MDRQASLYQMLQSHFQATLGSLLLASELFPRDLETASHSQSDIFEVTSSTDFQL